MSRHCGQRERQSYPSKILERGRGGLLKGASAKSDASVGEKEDGSVLETEGVAEMN